MLTDQITRRGAGWPLSPALCHELCPWPPEQRPWARDCPSVEVGLWLVPSSGPTARGADLWGWQGWGVPGALPAPPCKGSSPSIEGQASSRIYEAFGRCGGMKRARQCHPCLLLPPLSPLHPLGPASPQPSPCTLSTCNKLGVFRCHLACHRPPARQSDLLWEKCLFRL